MPTLTITVTIQVPDNRDEVNRLVRLLRHADDEISRFAHTQIQGFDTLTGELSNALPYPHPPAYTQRINDYYNQAKSWNRARMIATSAVWHITHKVMESLNPEDKSNDQAAP